MKNTEIEINGEKYPCRLTMGAMLRFKEETGKEVPEMDQNSLTEACTLMYFCAVSACKADKRDFDMSLMDFADAVQAGDLEAWSARIQEAGPEGGAEPKKKGPA